MALADPDAASRAARVAERVRAIPPGFVRTFADIDPAAPRTVGRILATFPSVHPPPRGESSTPPGPTDEKPS